MIGCSERSLANLGPVPMPGTGTGPK